MAEPDVVLTPAQMRQPNIAYFTDGQIQESRLGEDIIPAFVVEVISPTDDAEAAETKISEYFKAGVRVVWQIYPGNQLMYIYTSRKDVTICLEDDICSAAPVLPDFAVSINTLFAPPTA